MPSSKVIVKRCGVVVSARGGGDSLPTLHVITLDSFVVWLKMVSPYLGGVIVCMMVYLVWSNCPDPVVGMYHAWGLVWSSDEACPYWLGSREIVSCRVGSISS